MRLAFAFWLVIPALAWAASAPENLLETAVDGKGIVWGCENSDTGHVWRFDGSAWMPASLLFNLSERPYPVGMATMKDGAVMCIWHTFDNSEQGANSFTVTRHLGDESRLVGTCPGGKNDNELGVEPLADTRGRLWITGGFPEIYRADAQGVRLVRKIAPDECDLPGNWIRQYNLVHAVEDGHGRVWVWSRRGASNQFSLRGVLIFTDDKSDLHVSLGGINTANITSIVRADDRHMWVAVAQDGIYRVDIDTLTAEKEKEPGPRLFSWPEELFADGNDLYAVVKAMPGAQAALWRRRGAQWSEIEHQFDIRSAIFGDRWWLPVKEGLLIQSFSGGPWFVPKKGAPAQFTWETKPPLGEMRALVQLPDGTFFGLDRVSQMFHGPLSLPPQSQTASRVTILDGEAGWVVAATGRIWMLSHRAPIVLKEWDGQTWTPHPFEESPAYVQDLLEDYQGRLWTQAVKVVIFDPKTAQWQTFPDYDAAFLAMKDHPVQFRNDRWFRSPQYSEDRKRIAYRLNVAEIRYFDGTKWKNWQRKEIIGKNDNDNAVGPPWFDQDGHLRVNLRNKTGWMLSDSGDWVSAKYETHFPADIWSENAVDRGRTPPVPEGCITNHPESIAMDNLGTCWLAWNGALYRAIPGLCVKVFADSEPDPFHIPHQLREAYVDAQGNVFLLTAATMMERIMIRPKAPAPQTRIVLEQKAADSVVAHFHSDSPNVVTWRWQLDDNAPTLGKADFVALDNLPNGPHLLKVTAIDDQLSMEASPATAKFEVHVQPGEQLAQLIAQLSDPDYARRKAAIAALALQPEAARPALLNARTNATEDQQWWIDAALQECERSSQSQLQKPK